MPRFTEPIALVGPTGAVILEIAGAGAAAHLALGGNGVNGEVKIYAASALRNQRVGEWGGPEPVIHLSGEQGDIILANADCAEEFDLHAPSLPAPPGTVMVLDDEGRLAPCSTAYDRRVAGIVSGAGVHRPAIILDRRPGQTGRTVIALVGKVFCQVDASYGPVQVGDLLTTAATPGHAMSATDPTRAFGAVLGKALRPLDNGTGLIPVLVALQ